MFDFNASARFGRATAAASFSSRLPFLAFFLVFRGSDFGDYLEVSVRETTSYDKRVGIFLT